MAELDEALALAAAALGGTPRAGQAAMSHAVAGAIDSPPGSPEHLLVQAGTGTGKSLAYLVPAMLHAASGGPVIVATATLALQRQLVDRDLPVVAAALEPALGREPSYAVLKGRNNYVCLDRLHRVDAPGEEDDDDRALFEAPRSELGRHAKRVMDWAHETETGDRDEFPEPIDARVWRSISVGRRECVGESKCRFGTECFTVKRREIAMKSDIVVTNHSMLAIHFLEGIPVLPEHDALIVDEAHELVDRATQALTLELSARSVELAAQRAKPFADARQVDDLYAAGDELAEVLGRQKGRFLEPGRDLILALTRVRDCARAALSGIESDGDADTQAPRQRARGALDDLFDIAGRFIAAGTGEVTWVGEDDVARLAPMQVAGRLRHQMFAEQPVVLTSATLTVGGSFDSVAAALGLADDPDSPVAGPRWQGLDVGSPFDYEKQAILYVARHLPPPGRDGIPEEALDEIGDLIVAAGGRTLVLCSSWRAVERVGDYLRVRAPQPAKPDGVADGTSGQAGGYLVQRRGDTVAALVDRFAADPQSTLVGTMSLWQGVDVPGPSCTLVVIDRIPFPRPDDPVLSARQEAVDKAGGSGFASVSVPRAGLLLAQGAGRLIRDTTDRGVVAVLDPRLATASYARTLRASLPPMWFTTDKKAVVGALQRLDEAHSQP